MSLRDQLLAKGLATRKDVQRVERQLKHERHSAQGARRSKSELEAEERAKAAALAAEREAERVRQRQAAAAARDEVERELRARNLIDANRTRRGTGQPWWFRNADGTVERTDVSSGTAHELRSGASALVRLVRASGPDVVVVPRATALRLRAFAPEHVLVLVEDVSGISDASERFLTRTWEASLAPRRATAEDVERLRRGR